MVHLQSDGFESGYVGFAVVCKDLPDLFFCPGPE